MLVDKTIKEYNFKIFSGKVLVISDVHFPYHDTDALNVITKLVRNNKFHTIILNGDIIDCTRLSTKFHNPSKTFFEDELEMARQFISVLKYESRNKNVNIIYNLGNHETRANKYLAEKAPELYNVFVPFEKLLNMDDVILAGGTVINSNLLVKHGEIVRKDCGQSAMGEMLKEFKSGVSGHTHRLCRVHYRGRVWIECGCLCSLNPIYVNNPNWQQGFAILEYKKKELIKSMAIPIVSGELDYIKIKGMNSKGEQNEVQ